MERFNQVRGFTEELCAPLSPEDCMIQSMPEASPTRWHLAHTTWFFETFLLKSRSPDRKGSPAPYEHLFNSYYNSVGEPFPRPRRGVISRPGLGEIREYRRRIDDEVRQWILGAGTTDLANTAPILELGLQHEQQHQELILTDIKHAFSLNPMKPAYRDPRNLPGTAVRLAGTAAAGPGPTKWIEHPGGIAETGYAGDGFAFDNESPRHKVFLTPFAIADRPVTNGDYIEFVRDRGYDEPRLWLSDGWDRVRGLGWKAPQYWEPVDGGAALAFTCSGLRPLDPAEPVCHLSYYEADAYARWTGFRLPTEQEWEAVADGERIDGNFVESGRFHPAPIQPDASKRVRVLYGDVWEWTSSPYVAYPGYRLAEGALGEYNGKFMSGQMVLRGGSCATSITHIRSTYRNFFAPDARWQFMGFRLARDL
jgi:ergothioneine biosynthesis protein EgtB